MALNQLPFVEATIQVVHTGPTAGASFTATLDASDGGPIALQQVYTFDLTVFAPGMVGVFPTVEVYLVATGDKVEADVKVTSSLVTITFFEAVEPTGYRAKVIG